MKAKYRYIHFKKMQRGEQWACLNNRSKDILGRINYNSRWKQFVIDFRENCIFNNQCLCEIADFLTQLNCDRKVEK